MPERSTHCRECKKCVLRTDHHCPWIGDHVGSHNMKEFYLFVTYQGIIGGIYTIYAARYVFLREEDDPHDLSMFGSIVFYSANLFSIFPCFGLWGMSPWTLLGIYNNHTNEELRRPLEIKIPCLGKNCDQRESNIYDLLWLTNTK